MVSVVGAQPPTPQACRVGTHSKRGLHGAYELMRQSIQRPCPAWRQPSNGFICSKVMQSARAEKAGTTKPKTRLLNGQRHWQVKKWTKPPILSPYTRNHSRPTQQQQTGRTPRSTRRATHALAPPLAHSQGRASEHALVGENEPTSGRMVVCFVGKAEVKPQTAHKTVLARWTTRQRHGTQVHACMSKMLPCARPDCLLQQASTAMPLSTRTEQPTAPNVYQRAD